MILKNKPKISKRTFILILVVTSIFILLWGIYRVYEIFYPSYFNQTEYTQISFIGNEKIPTKSEILFSGFKNIEVIIVSSIISFFIVSAKKLFLSKNKNNKNVPH